MSRMAGKILIALPQTGSKINSCGDPLPCELESGNFLVLAKMADQYQCNLEFSNNPEVFLAGKISNSCAHYLLGLAATLTSCYSVRSLVCL